MAYRALADAPPKTDPVSESLRIGGTPQVNTGVTVIFSAVAVEARTPPRSLPDGVTLPRQRHRGHARAQAAPGLGAATGLDADRRILSPRRSA
jgi:hypothetical protein